MGRGCALAANVAIQVASRACARWRRLTWTPAAMKNYTDFSNRMVVHGQRLAQMGVNYNPSADAARPRHLDHPGEHSTPTTPSSGTLPALITAAGRIDVSFYYTSGSYGLDIQWVALLEDGVQIDRDTIPGSPAASPSSDCILPAPAVPQAGLHLHHPGLHQRPRRHRHRRHRLPPQLGLNDQALTLPFILPRPCSAASCSAAGPPRCAPSP